MVTPAARREAAAYLLAAFAMSERQACRVVGVDRSSVRYRASKPDDGVLRERLKALAQERRRFGYRRLNVLLRREGHAVNEKRVLRLYREEKLTLRIVVDESGQSEHARRSTCPCGRTSAGAWTSSRTE